MKRFANALLALLAVSGAGAVLAQEVTPQAEAIATQLLDHMDAARYSEAEAMFTQEMAQAVPAATLKTVWESIPAQAGAAQGRGEITLSKESDVTLATVPLHYDKAEAVAQVTIAADGKISGFVVQPAAAAPTPAPAVAANAPYTERDFAAGDGERALPGTLAMPKGTGPFPAVVLVHGSGPQDRDETIGPNKPFLDIARGLAAQGIATLRYDKRTNVHPQEYTNRDFTIDDETTNDAVAAVAALRKAEGIDAKRVFILGHSQGGMLAPRIASKAGNVAGLVLLAAPARPLLDILVEQNQRIAVLDDAKTSDAERTAIEKLKAQVQAAREDSSAKADALPLGLPGAYWRSTDAVDPVAEATKAGLPMLVLQGTRDIQVVDADWQRWKSGFGRHDKVEFKLYERLNHLGMPGEGEGSLAEYGKPGQVDAQLIGDVAGWIKAH